MRPGRAAFARDRKSSTTSESVKWPTCRRSREATPRRCGKSSAARRRRSASGQRGPARVDRSERLGDRLLVQVCGRVADDLQARSSTSWLVDPQAVSPWPPSTAPMTSGSLADSSACAGPAPSRAASTAPTRPSRPRSAAPALAVGRARQRDHRVGVQVVDVRVVDQRVHRRVDRRRGTAGSVAAVGEQADHLVLVLDAAVHLVQRHQPVALEHRQAVGLECAEVAAGALDVEQLHLLAGGRADLGHLGRGVAAAVVGHGRVRARAGCCGPAARGPRRGAGWGQAWRSDPSTRSTKRRYASSSEFCCAATG